MGGFGRTCNGQAEGACRQVGRCEGAVTVQRQALSHRIADDADQRPDRGLHHRVIAAAGQLGRDGLRAVTGDGSQGREAVVQPSHGVPVEVGLIL